MPSRPTLAYLMDPRFRGGTSSSFVAEISVTTRMARVRVFALSGGMLRGQRVLGQVDTALAALGLEVEWDPAVVAADVVVVHNPIFLSGGGPIAAKIVAKDLIVVAHENFLRPGGAEGFDVGGTLGRIAGVTTTLRRWIAPVSAYNRRTVVEGLTRAGASDDWRVTPEDWTNVVTGPMAAPTSRPSDRRGRHSREGLEKFPDRATMETLFPAHADANLILGDDLLTAEERTCRHWTTWPFGAMPVAEFLSMIDFMVYYTAPTWHESFGRAVAEAVVAGKIVIADPSMREIFGDAILTARPDEVDGIIGRFVADPFAYAGRVLQAQAALIHWSPEAFASRVEPIFAGRLAA